MSDYDEESDYDVEDDSFSEEEDELLDDESMDEDDLMAKDLNKLETKIALGKSGKGKQPAKKRESKAKEKGVNQTENKASTNKRQKKDAPAKEVKEKKEKKVKEPKEEKKTQKQIKEELKEEERQQQAIEDSKYFYHQPTFEEKQQAGKEIKELAEQFVKGNSIDEILFASIILKYHLSFPQENLHFVQQIIQEVFERLKASPKLCFQIQTVINNHFYWPKPCVQETMFFPNRENEKKLANVLRKAKKSLDICVFAFTNDRFRDAILYAYSKGAKVRIITDDECSKFMGADVFALGAQGIPCTMDNDWKVHMHNKFAIVDELVLVTGSFNWTSQAVNQNQENLIVIENQHLIKAYKAEFEKLWIQFEKNRLTKADCEKKLIEEEQLKQQRIQKMNDARKAKQQAK